jgi:ADP-dependent NAD(P)H-hydrate dehydratase
LKKPTNKSPLNPMSQTNRKHNKTTTRKTTKSVTLGDGRSTTAAKPIILTSRILRRWPLPIPEDGSKEERGRVLVVGGAPELPGAVILAATAAMRAGAGKLQIAVIRSIQPLVAAAMPEAKVIALAETKAGSIALSAIAELAESANSADAVLIGPGLADQPATTRLMLELLPRLQPPMLVLDAAALTHLAETPQSLHGLNGQVAITPHAGEMAQILGIDKTIVIRDQLKLARQAAEQLQAVVALKGVETFIAAPGAASYCNQKGNVGLATSGSGDVLAGIIAGMAARGASPQQSVVWGVFLHASAGDRLARKIGPLGFLARELPGEIPRLINELAQPAKK